MKMTVLYYTRTGNTKRMAEIIAEAMTKEGGEAKAFALDAIDESFIAESKVVVVGTPTYLASMAGEVKTWFDRPNPKYALPGKLAGAFATEDYVHGGGDLAIQSILSHMMVMGMLAYSAGGSQGKPVIHLGPVALKDADADETFRIYGSRMAKKALELFG